MGPAGDIGDGAVAVSQADGLICAVGNYASVAAEFPGALSVGDSRDILVPGFINAHDHLSEGLISGIGKTMNLYEWQELSGRIRQARDSSKRKVSLFES
jgi:5-methylthioadenosine/S-adenosylhomocysteine deaminase